MHDIPVWMQLFASSFAGGSGVWVAIRMDIKYLRRDVDKLEVRTDKHNDRISELERAA